MDIRNNRDKIINYALEQIRNGQEINFRQIDQELELQEGLTFLLIQNYDELSHACVEKLLNDVIAEFAEIFNSDADTVTKIKSAKKCLMRQKELALKCEAIRCDDSSAAQKSGYSIQAISNVQFHEAVSRLVDPADQFAEGRIAVVSYGIWGLLADAISVTDKFRQLNVWLDGVLESEVIGDQGTDYKIFVINPGSTSTKLALFKNDTCLFSTNVFHDSSVLAQFPTCNAQLSYRKEVIDRFIAENGIDLSDVDAIVGRGGGLVPMLGGVYAINDRILEDTRTGRNGVDHPALLGPQLAHLYAEKYGVPSYILNPPDLDEFTDVARMTGIKGVYRPSHLHALNLKEMAIRHAKKLGKRYEDCNFIVCHIDGGVSVSAHRYGMMIDGNDIAGGDGPMTPTRCGSISVAAINNFGKDLQFDEMKKLYSKAGGFVSHFNTSDSDKVHAMVEAGDHHAVLVWNAMIYQINKNIGAMATVLGGKIDAIILGGGLLRFDDLVEQIREQSGWIAPVAVYPGEFENEAMAAGAIRVLKGEEQVREYTGEPVWNGFDFDQ